ncbi:MAG: BatD family protein [Bacteroidota bacterium]
MKRYLLIFSVIIFVLNIKLYAEDINIEASAPSEVALGERFRIAFSMNANPSEFSPPSFANFRILSGPNQSSSSSVQVINGKVTKSQSYTYTYILEAQKEGNFTIGSAIVKDGNKEFRSNKLSIKVVKGKVSSPSPGASQKQISSDNKISENDIFIKAQISKSNPYQGEQLTISYKIYTRLNIAQYSFAQIPDYKGFWSESIDLGSNQQSQTEVVDGNTYRVAEIRRNAIFPQRSGEYSIEPLELECIVQIPSQRSRRSLIDDFFGGGYQNERIIVSSNEVKLNVKPLPSQNRPASFDGLVGKFDIKASLTNSELKSNDATNLEVAISGRGNIRKISKPQIQFPLNLDFFDPNINDNIKVGRTGVSGSRTFDYLLIPRTGGEFVIPPIQFSYFDPELKKYITKTTEEFVIKSVSSHTTEKEDYSSRSKEVQLLADEIRFIYADTFDLSPKGQYFFKSRSFYILTILPVLLFIILIFYRRRHIQIHSNKALLKNRRAQKVAKKRLKKAGYYLEHNLKNEFYDEISKVLFGYISDKLNLPLSRLNKDNIENALNEKHVPAELSGQFLSALDECDYARFAPGNHQDMMENIYEKTSRTIINIEKDFKSKNA